MLHFKTWNHVEEPFEVGYFDPFDILIPQLCCPSSCANVKIARKVTPTLEFYKIYTAEGEVKSMGNIWKG